MLYTPDVLELAAGGRESGGIQHVGLPGLQGDDAVGPAVSHYLQRRGGCGSKAMRLYDVREGGGSGQVWKGGQTPTPPLLCG